MGRPPKKLKKESASAKQKVVTEPPELLVSKFAEKFDLPISTVNWLIASGKLNYVNRLGRRYVNVEKGLEELKVNRTSVSARGPKDAEAALEAEGDKILGEEKEEPKQKPVIVQGHMGEGPVGQLSDVADEPVPTTGLTYQQARAHREAYEARNKELEFRRKRGELVDKREVEQRAFEAGRMIRDALLGIPDRLAAELAAETDTNVVHSKITAALTSALEALSHGADANEGKPLEVPAQEEESDDAAPSAQEAPFNP